MDHDDYNDGKSTATTGIGDIISSPRTTHHHHHRTYSANEYTEDFDKEFKVVVTNFAHGGRAGKNY